MPEPRRCPYCNERLDGNHCPRCGRWLTAPAGDDGVVMGPIPH